MRGADAIVRLGAVVVVLAIATSARAQPCGTGGPPFATVPGVVKVTLRAGGTLKATLVCVDANMVILLDAARIRQVPLADVVRIVKPGVVDCRWRTGRSPVQP